MSCATRRVHQLRSILAPQDASATDAPDAPVAVLVAGQRTPFVKAFGQLMQVGGA